MIEIIVFDWQLDTEKLCVVKIVNPLIAEITVDYALWHYRSFPFFLMFSLASVTIASAFC
jgi:hypothetical protein